ncbi:MULTISPECIES: sulfatase [unclassified Microbacterium]|uniref:sulfatase family protein n=1 Tax=unclassified Microbacterium TaxID=2609290 RepID=UPI0012FA68C5|nr:sulfatase [Microbacterium sp. MAH-37]MVQ43423.1 sulfatase-like hydrolase/transferase [Microbacterium sp. MAH-37]
MQPDIILFHCHDLGRWLPTYGMPAVPAPQISAFADQSIVFDDAHAAAPLCSPSRGALFTGMQPYRNGIQGLAHDGWRYRAGVSTLPERLEPLGYHTALIGLQHENVDPTVLGFAEYPGQGFLPRTAQVVEAASSWLGGLPPRSERKPIFLTVGVWEVHRPWPASDYAAADPASVDVPGYLPDNADTRADIADFYGSIAQLDAGFSVLLDAISSTIGDENTMIVFTTDHGAAFPRAKSTLYDAGTGVALIVRPPTAWQVSPRRVPDLVIHQDLLPTFLEIAGDAGPHDAELEGRSLLSLITTGHVDASQSERMVFTSKTYHDSYDPKRAVRTSDYVYIRNYREGPKLELPADLEASRTRQGFGDGHLAPRPQQELYDRRVDPLELVDVAGQDAYADVQARLSAALHERLVAIADPVESEPIPRAPWRSRHVDDLPSLPSLPGSVA